MGQLKTIFTPLAHLLPHSTRLSIYRRLGELRHKAVLGQYASAVLTETWNGTLLVASNDFSIGQTLAFQGEYERKKIEQLCTLVNQDTDVLVVGAHVGALAIPLARRSKAVRAIEANPTTFDFLTKNVGLNHLQNLACLHFAAGDRDGEVEFLCGSYNSGASRVKQRNVKGGVYSYDKMVSVVVPMKVLDREFPDRIFGLITMDIEGAETLALKGMQGLLARAHAFSVEVVPTHVDKLAASSKEMLLTQIAPHFEYAHILGGALSYTRENFPDMFSWIWRRRKEGTGEDVLFLKGTRAAM